MMNILSIETSCDETAIALLQCEGGDAHATFTILGNALISQIDIHKEYGGVYPALAKRAHAENIVPILTAALQEAGMHKESADEPSEDTVQAVTEILSREPGLTDRFLRVLTTTKRPAIDAIAVTHGPGLEPALWVGVNFARALSRAWNIPIIPINHMEGHFLAALGSATGKVITIENVRLPVLGLLISGGHTELDVMSSWLSYELLGATRDDAVGEAFDKVARMLDLPYPGGPEISKLAERDREKNTKNPFTLPRPMLDSNDFDFSFSGIKTAVLYLLKERGELTETEKEQLARAFEDAVSEVLWAKTSRALSNTGAKMLVIGGGVSANKHLQRLFADMVTKDHPEVTLHIPSRELTTDNAVMIGIAGYYRTLRKEFSTDVTANGNLHLAP